MKGKFLLLSKKDSFLDIILKKKTLFDCWTFLETRIFLFFFIDE